MKARRALTAITSAFAVATALTALASGRTPLSHAADATPALGGTAKTAHLTTSAGLGGQPVITSGNMGMPTLWLPRVGGDTWYNTWADDGNIYSTADDPGPGVCPNGSNLVVNELTGSDPSELSSPYTNCMTSYGPPGSSGDYGDGASWKNDGIISVDGTLYLAVARQVDGYGGYPAGYQSSTDASIVKSTDLGRTWSNGFGTTDDPNGAAPPPKPASTAAPSTETVSCTLGATNTCSGLEQQDSSGDGVTQPVQVGGLSGRETVQVVPNDLNMYFDVDDNVACTGSYTATFTVQYYDQGTNSWQLQYDSNDASAPLSGAFKTAGSIQQQNSGTWKTATFSVSDARFAGRENGYDFRIDSVSPVIVHSVNVQITGSLGGNCGAEAMFPGKTFATPEFIQYGQDDNPSSTADGGDTYVYAISNDGWAYDGSYMILGRVLRSKIGNLNAADWEFYTGPPGGKGMASADWSSDASRATHIISAPHQLSQAGVQYIQALHTYVLTSFYYPFNDQWPENGTTAHTTWSFYEAPHPWGPWTRFFSQPTVECYITCTAQSATPIGLYDPAMVSKFINMNGLSDVIFTTGDYINSSRTIDPLYELHAVPFTLTTRSCQVVDDTAPGISYQGSWSVAYNAGGYYDTTYHAAGQAGSVASYTFTGTSIAWVGSKNVNHGDASVSVDGGPPMLVDTYNPDWIKQQVLFEKSGLPDGHHTITITSTSKLAGVDQDIDAFIVCHSG